MHFSAQNLTQKLLLQTIVHASQLNTFFIYFIMKLSVVLHIKKYSECMHHQNNNYL